MNSAIYSYPLSKRPSSTNEEMPVGNRKPLSRVSSVMPSQQAGSSKKLQPTNLETPQRPSHLDSLIQSALEQSSEIISNDLELQNVWSEFDRLVLEQEALQSECVQAQYERDLALLQLKDLVNRSHCRIKTKMHNHNTEPPLSHRPALCDKMALSHLVLPVEPEMYPTMPAFVNDPSFLPPEPLDAPQLSSALPKLELCHIQAMYHQFNDNVYCCICLMQNSGAKRRTSPKSFPTSQLSLDDLVQHSAFNHPMSFSEITGLTVDQVKELQQMLKS